jgi:hypothetical protein
MFRTTDMVLIVVMVCAAGFTYTTKHDAEAELSKLRKLEAAIRFEEETIDVLKADWSLLTQPSRLQKLAETYQVEAHQIATIEELPARPLRIEDIVEDAMAESEGSLDGVVTGSVGQ